MDFFTVIVIGFAIYSFIEKAKRKNQSGSTIPGKLTSIGEMFSGRDTKSTSFREIFNQWVESQNPKPVLESEQFPERNFSELSEAPDRRAEEPTQFSSYGGSLVGVSTEGEQGVEGLQGVEGTSLTGTAENYQDTKAGLPPEVRVIRQPSSLNLGLNLTGREIMQGIVWAEVLGRPRALRPFRRSR